MAYPQITDSEQTEYPTSNRNIMAEKAVTKATKQLMASTEFKKPRLARVAKYQALYNNKTPKKLRQLFNVPIPVFAGMVDTLNAQYDEPIRIEFTEGDPSDYFKVEKINALFQKETMDTAQNSKWESKLRIARKEAIMTGRGVVRYTVQSDPEYESCLEVVPLKDFHFQPKGGKDLENHLFAGQENIQKTASQLKQGAKSGIYNKEQVNKLINAGGSTDYLPDSDSDYETKLARFKPLGLDPDNHSFVGEAVYNLCEWILNIDGERYYLLFHPWSQCWLRFEKWKDIDSSGLYPWHSFATHEDEENFLSKSFADDLYPSADAIVAMFNQEMTNREKRNFSARAYDKDMFKDVRKLDEAMHRPDALVPANTMGGAKRISEGIFEFKTAELNGTVNLIDWISGTLGRNTGASDLAQGSVQEVSKKASVTFAEQQSISKRVGWQSQPFQEMMAGLAKAYVFGLKDHMPSKMAIRVLGENGIEWDEITRLDLDTKKDIDVQIISTNKELADSELEASRKKEALTLLYNDQSVNPKKKVEEVLKWGGYSDQDIAEFLDIKTYADKRSLARASMAIQEVLTDSKPELWYGATTAFMQKIIDYAKDNRTTLKDNRYNALLDYAMAHKDIVKDNLDRKATEFGLEQAQMMAGMGMAGQPQQGGGLNLPPQPKADNPGLPGGVSKALEISKLAG